MYGGRAAAMKKNKPPEYRGVSWHKGHHKYHAKIYAGAMVHLGDFDDAATAALLRDAAERLVRGPDAVLNFPKISSSLANSAHAINLLKAAGVRF
jgi:hypothetical protein